MGIVLRNTVTNEERGDFHSRAEAEAAAGNDEVVVLTPIAMPEYDAHFPLPCTEAELVRWKRWGLPLPQNFKLPRGWDDD